MSEKSSFKKTVIMLISLLVVLATLLVFWHFGDRKFYLTSVLVILYAMVPFFLRFESRKPQPRELVMIAVLCALAVASRAAFVFMPQFKPITAIVMIAGIAFGAETGFLVGAMSAFVSNFIFGQGAWTPWQMFAFGMAGVLASWLSKWKLINPDKPSETAVFGGFVVLLIIGPLLDTCTLFTMSTSVTAEAAMTVYISGVPANIIHALATMIMLFFFGKPLIEKLHRVQVKYGMLREGEL